MTDKQIFAENLLYYMELKGVSRRELSDALGISYYTLTDWIKGKKYPRMDKVQMLADYFGIKKSDLIEKKVTEEAQKNNDIMADIIVRMRTDEDFFEAVQTLNSLDKAKLSGVMQMLQAFAK